ncbi:MAG: MgtC/SapB family protein [Candidatus Omnitrophota bacterium]
MILDINQITMRLLLAAILSGIIGYERELHGRAAGLRTTILVGVGSCLIMITSMNLFEIYRGVANVDPSRIAAQVVSGIGFLGAGTILRFRASVKGLTTAAGLWAVAGIGLAVGSGFYLPALLTTSIIFIVLATLSRLERKIKKSVDKVIKIDASGALEELSEITKAVSLFNAEIKNIEITPAPTPGTFNLSLQVQHYTVDSINKITDQLMKVKGVTAVKWV